MARHPCSTPLYSVLFVAAFDAVTFVLLVRMSGNGGGRHDSHKLARVAGLLAFFVVFAVRADLENGFAGRSFVSLAAVYAFWKLWRSTNGERRWRVQPIRDSIRRGLAVLPTDVVNAADRR